MDPSSSNCENIDDESIRDNEDYEMDFLSSVAALLDCEDFRDDDAPKELGMNTPPPPPPLGDAEEELSTNVVRAAMDGKVRIFNKPNLNNGHFFKKTREQNNILHVAVRYKQKEFVRAFLKRYFIFNKKLISERNSHGNTPLHVAAQVGDKGIAMLLFNYLKKSVEGGHEGDKEKPWKAQNSKGNTALHVALLCNNNDVAESLVKRDGGLAGIINNSKEAPLHLAINHLNPFACEDLTRVLLAKARCVASWRDAKGLTPLHRAASLHPWVIVEVTKMIIKYCPESTLVCDPSGKSFLHLLIHNKIFEVKQKNLDKGFKFNYKEDIENLISLKEITILKDHQDQEGNTPLHIAIKYENITMVRYLLSKKCFADYNITNKDGISARFWIDQQNLWHQLHEPRTMTVEESSSANKGDIKFLLDRMRTFGLDFYGLQDSKGSNFLHLLMSKKTEHHYHSFSDDSSKFFDFIETALFFFPRLVCQTDQKGNAPLHILAQNKDLCKTLEDLTLGESRSLLSKLLYTCVDFITRSRRRRTNTNEANNHDQLPWVMQNEDGNTPLHEAIIANNKVLVLQLLSYSEESARLVNNKKETPLNLLAATSISMEEFTVEEIMKMVKANYEALGLPNQDGLTPLSRTLEAKNLNVVVTLLCNFQEFSNANGPTLWEIFLQNQKNNFLDELLKNEAFKKMLEQKNKDGNTPLHIAIKKQYFGFVKQFLETWGIEHDESSEDNQWLMQLIRIPNNVGQTSEGLLADLPTISVELEEKLLTDRRMRGIRSSWRIPRTQLQYYMNSMNVIAALQTTITFTAAFTVPGGLIQDTGTPILIRSIAFQVFIISDIIAMCLSMMVLICLLWMVATNKRESVMIQDFAVTLLLASFVATLMTFMAGVYATIYPVKQWIAIATLVLCSFLMLLVQKFMVTKLLLPFKNATSNFVHMLWDPAAEFCPKFLLSLTNATSKLLGPAATFCFKTLKKLKGNDSDCNIV